MRMSIPGVLSALLVITPSVFANGLPDPIAEYYRDLNFVNTYGQTTELVKLEDRLWEEDLPRDLVSDRARKLRDSMRRVLSKTTMTDPGMAMVWGRHFVRLPHPDFDRTLREVLSFQANDGICVVKVRRHALRRKTAERLVSAYVASGVRPDEDVLPSTRLQSFHGMAEYHRWTQTSNGHWMKSDVNVVLTHGF